jgi:hypothetical protein
MKITWQCHTPESGSTKEFRGNGGKAKKLSPDVDSMAEKQLLKL